MSKLITPYSERQTQILLDHYRSEATLPEILQMVNDLQPGEKERTIKGICNRAAKLGMKRPSTELHHQEKPPQLISRRMLNPLTESQIAALYSKIGNYTDLRFSGAQSSRMTLPPPTWIYSVSTADI